jgi:hypothetical protein
MAKLAVTIRHALKLRRKNSHRKTSLDNLVSAVLSDYLHFAAPHVADLACALSPAACAIKPLLGLCLPFAFR